MLGAGKLISGVLVGSAIVVPATITLTAPPRFSLRTDKKFNKESCQVAANKDSHNKQLIVCRFDLESDSDNSPKFFLYTEGYPPEKVIEITSWQSRGNEVEIKIGSAESLEDKQARSERIKVPTSSDWNQWSGIGLANCDFKFENNTNNNGKWKLECPPHINGSRLGDISSSQGNKKTFWLTPLIFK